VEAGGKLKRRIEERFKNDIKRLSLLWPSEHLYIDEVANGRTSVRLHSGDWHEFDPDDVTRLLSRVPRYFWKIMKVPIVLRYEKHENGYTRCLVEGDVWQRRLVELLVKGEVSSEGLEEVSIHQFRLLLGSYGSLVFVRVTM